MHSYGSGGTVVHIETGIDGLETKRCLFSGSHERGFGAPSWSGNRMKVNIMRKSTVWVVLQDKFYLVPYPGTNETSWYGPVEGPEKVSHPVTELHFLLNNLHFHLYLGSPPVAHWPGEVGWLNYRVYNGAIHLHLLRLRVFFFRLFTGAH